MACAMERKNIKKKNKQFFWKKQALLSFHLPVTIPTINWAGWIGFERNLGWLVAIRANRVKQLPGPAKTTILASECHELFTSFRTVDY